MSDYSDGLGGGLSGGWGGNDTSGGSGLSIGADTSGGYGLGVGTDAGFNAGGYDIGGGLGSGLNGGSLGYGYSAPIDYNFNSPLASMGALGYADDTAGVGLRAEATPAAAGYTLGYDPSKTAFSAKEDQGFWGSAAQKKLSMLAMLNPVTALLNGVVGVAQSKDPVQAGIQALLGQFGGLPGRLANVGYNASQSSDPAGYLGAVGATTLAGQVGGNIAGVPGATALSGLVGNAINGAAADNRSTGAFGTASPMEAGIASAQNTSGNSVAGQGSGRNWTDTLASIASGVYGMKQASAQRALAQSAAAPSEAASAALQKVIAGDFTGDAGYDAAQKAAARASAAQPGGFASNAAAQAALNYQNQRIATLSGATTSGVSTALGGTQQGINTSMAGVAELARGITGNSTGTNLSQVPTWLQSWFLKNGMGA